MLSAAAERLGVKPAAKTVEISNLKTCERGCSGVLDFCVLLDCSFGGFLCCSGDIYVISLVPVHMQHPQLWQQTSPDTWVNSFSLHILYTFLLNIIILRYLESMMIFKFSPKQLIRGSLEYICSNNSSIFNGNLILWPKLHSFWNFKNLIWMYVIRPWIKFCKDWGWEWGFICNYSNMYPWLQSWYVRMWGWH